MRLAANGQGAFGLGGNAVAMPSAADVAAYLRTVPSGFYSIVPSANATNMPPGWRVDNAWIFETIKINSTPLIVVLATNAGSTFDGVGSVFFRGYITGNSIAWDKFWTAGNLANPMTLDAAQNVGGVKTFGGGSSTPIRLMAQSLGNPVFIPFFDAGGGTRKGWIGKGSANNDTITLLNDSPGSKIELNQNGNVNIFVGTSGGEVYQGENQRFLVQNRNAVVDANGSWVVPGSAGSVSINDLAGIPLPYPGTVAPTGWLKCNGQSFDKTLYPVLASRYPSGVLPDLRGEFVRGWDDGRGVDAGRALLSAQSDAIRNITGTFNPGGNGVGADQGLFTTGDRRSSNSGSAIDSAEITFDASKVVPTANENRPRNIAFNYIVRAA
ncbi:tail fiber protein [Pectobacterium odoriferum]|nr:tail fiber protein [Pectobacterium odoriferum]